MDSKDRGRGCVVCVPARACRCAEGVCTQSMRVESRSGCRECVCTYVVCGCVFCQVKLLPVSSCLRSLPEESRPWSDPRQEKRAAGEAAGTFSCLKLASEAESPVLSAALPTPVEAGRAASWAAAHRPPHRGWRPCRSRVTCCRLWGAHLL